MTIVVHRLNEGARTALKVHFLALSPEDRRLRFGSTLSAESIIAYVEGIDFDRDAVFGVRDDRLRLVGVTHAAFGDDLAELGLSVLPAHRGHGVGGALFERSVAHARNRFVSRLYMNCLEENAPIMHIARRFGMSVVSSAGDAEAHLLLPPASPASLAAEFVTNSLAEYDHALKLQVRAWKRINAALKSAGPLEAG